MSSAEIKQNKSPKNIMKQFSSLPSCFLTPESAEKPESFGRVTPTQDQTSSVFLSPPSSLERKSVPNFGISTCDDPLKLELNFDDFSTRISSDSRSLRSPIILVHEDKIGCTRIDLITELLQRDFWEICQTICDCLNDRELSRLVLIPPSYLITAIVPFWFFRAKKMAPNSTRTRCFHFIYDSKMLISFCFFKYFYRFASVCKSWRNFAKKQHRIRDRLNFYLSQCKEYCILKGKVCYHNAFTRITKLL